MKFWEDDRVKKAAGVSAFAATPLFAPFTAMAYDDQGVSDLEGKFLGWDRTAADRKRQREATAGIENVELPELSGFGELSLEDYAAIDDLVNYKPETGEVFTGGDATTYQAQGYDPTFAGYEREGIANLADTELAGISLDPATRDKQMEALGLLSGLSTDGLTPGEQARLDLINAGASQQAKGARDALGMEMARRGISGSGLELMGKQMANQSAAESMRLQGLEANAMAQQRQMQALSQMADLAGAVRGQDYGIASDKARAQDAINAWNAANTQGVMGRNADRYGANQLNNAGFANDASRFGASAANAASQYNAGAIDSMNKFNAGQQQSGSFANAGITNAADQWRIGNLQNIQNSNTGLRNEENRWATQGMPAANNNVANQRYDNSIGKARDVYNAKMGLSPGENAAAGNRRQDTGKFVDIAAKAVASYFGGPAAGAAMPNIMNSNQQPQTQGYTGNSIEDEKKKNGMMGMFYA